MPLAPHTCAPAHGCPVPPAGLLARSLARCTWRLAPQHRPLRRVDLPRSGRPRAPPADQEPPARRIWGRRLTPCPLSRAPWCGLRAPGQQVRHWLVPGPGTRTCARCAGAGIGSPVSKQWCCCQHLQRQADSIVLASIMMCSVTFGVLPVDRLVVSAPAPAGCCCALWPLPGPIPYASSAACLCGVQVANKQCTYIRPLRTALPNKRTVDHVALLSSTEHSTANNDATD